MLVSNMSRTTKTIFLLIILIITIMSLLIYRNDNEEHFWNIRKYLTKNYVPEQSTEYNELSQQEQQDVQQQKLEQQMIAKKRISLNYKFLEYADRCYDLQIFQLSPANTAKDKTIKERVPEKAKSTTPLNFIIYIILIMLISLLAFDYMPSKEKQKKPKVIEAEEVDTRRCSLQDYKATRSPRDEAKPGNKKLFIRKSSAIWSSSSTLGTGHDMSPVRNHKFVRGEMRPLLRRASASAVPIPIDSEDDSSPDVKRRVRMLHRH